MIGVFDIVAVAGFSAAFIFAVLAMVRRRSELLTAPQTFAAAAMLIMIVSSVGNALENLGITSALQSREEYFEVLFLPFLTYLMYSLYAQNLSAKVEAERNVTDRLSERLDCSLTELGAHRVGLLQALSTAVDARDHYTALHSMHVADYACAIAYRLGLRDKIELFEQAGLLHDIGKIGVPDTLLLKPAHLTAEEYEQIKRHAGESAHIIQTVSFLNDVVPMVRHHHERWDGTGYPDGLAAEDIPVAARILAVADAFDAMTTDRPYRPGMTGEEAKCILIQGRGEQWDPAAVDALIELLDSGIVLVHGHSTAA